MSSAEKDRAAKPGAWRGAGVVLSIAAALVAGSLGYVSLQLRGTPWGCGAGSGCADVFKSRWSNVAGIPVGFLAAPLYLSLGALCALGRGELSARLLAVVASAVLTAAIYFILLQVVVLHAICPWCMLDHTLGISASLIGLLIARRLTPRATFSAAAQRTVSDPLAEDDAPREKLPPRSSALGSVAAGVAITLTFVVVQHFAGRTPEIARVESLVLEPGNTGDELKLTLENGEVSLQLGSLPVIGSSTAPRKLILMFDYCCPHCREAHQVIRRLQPTAGEDWQVMFVPTPLNSECNSAVEETEPRFKDACTLARLSLAVWKLRPDDWPAFDTWLFEPEMPRTAEEARQHAAAVYGEIELAEALAKPEIDAVIAADVKAYQASGSKVLPVILSPGSAGIAGRTDGEEELRAILKKEFRYPTP
jgi:uncharacterized membrane protein/protein-disulfide isomerase